MAPEHLRAALGRTAALIQAVDNRSDVYSLGMVLFEMLAGTSPFDQTASYFPLPVLLEAMALERSRVVPSLRQRRPETPWSLESIVRKCLAPDPAQRYQQAAHLADDLRCFLEDRPLRHAPELSQAERLAKWARRHPRLTWAGSVALTAALVLGTLAAVLAGTRAELGEAQSRQRLQDFEAGTVRTLCLLHTLSDLGDHLDQGQAVCRETLDKFQVLSRADWQEQPDWRRLQPDQRRRLAEDTRELLLLLAWARVHTAPGKPAILKQALGLVDQADAIEGLEPSRALWTARAYYLDKLGQRQQAAQARYRAARLPPAGARDHYLLATSYAQQGEYQRAVAELNHALAHNPRHYWSLVQRGICYQQLGEQALAASDFGTCVGLWPEFAWGHFNRGRILDQAGKKAEAIAAYTEALRLDPDLLLAQTNCGLARLELRQYREALADFDQVLARGRDDAFLHAGRGSTLEALGRAEEADTANP
jgi:tetratricopeptide (TPR) repeat protein